jgi:hypothetical protein
VPCLEKPNMRLMMNKFQESKIAKINDRVTDITFPLEKWRYFIIFQSASQALSWFVILLACMVFVSYLISLDGDANIPLNGVLIGAAIGSSLSLLAVLPAKFVVQNAGLSMQSEIEVHLLKMNYVEDVRFNDIVVYRQNLPRLLRWDESNIRIVAEGGFLTVSGACIPLRKLRKNIVSKFGN